jgi:hypothetical protein
MKYQEEIQAAHTDPESLEDLYHAAQEAQEEDQFRAALQSCYQAAPGDVLYAAWYYRLQRAPPARESRRAIDWKLAVPLALLTAVVFWFLSSPQLEFANGMPFLVLVWAPIGACAVIAFLTITSGADARVPAILAGVLLALTAYTTFYARVRDYQNYANLMIFHLPLLAWIGTGGAVLWPRGDHENRFAFIYKSFEVFVTGGLYLGAGVAFVGITVAMFEALDIRLSDEVMRILVAGGAGLVPVLAVTSAYDPTVLPIEQSFRQGLGRVIYTLMRLFLPLTLIVLIAYLLVIPFNFMEPFYERDVLIVYNAMLFAVMGMLVGATPMRANDLSERVQSALRAGILAVAILAVVVSVYAMSAIVYRTVQWGLTMNRLAIIGWNSINTAVLIWLTYRQFRDGRPRWVPSLHAVYSHGAVAYLAWALFLTLAIPFLFPG